MQVKQGMAWHGCMHAKEEHKVTHEIIETKWNHHIQDKVDPHAISSKYGNYTLGALQTLPQYKKILSRDIGLKELWEFRTGVILALPSGLFIGMM